MKPVWTALFIASLSPVALAGEAGGPVPQVLETTGTQQVGPVVVQFQESVPVQLRETIAGVSVGSSSIANVAVHDANTLLVTGRAYGSTSLHVIDSDGNIIVNTVIHVVDQSPNRVVVNRGGADYSMQCAPNCRPAPNLGDNSDYYQTIIQQAQSSSR